MSLIRVLVVDDSAFARKVLRECLATSSLIEVIGTARDGIDALEKITQLEPDVITLDLAMPNLDGIGVLAALPADQRSRVVVVSMALPADQRSRVVVVSMADGQSDLALAALASGAFDVVHKPSALAVASLHDICEELVSKVLLAARSRASRASSLPDPPRADFPAPSALSTPAHSERIVLVGTSTGGPQALTRLLKALPVGFPAPIAIVLHIPQGYTGPFAERLNGECAIEILEAKEGLKFQAGRAIIAKAGIHLKVIGGGPESQARLDLEPRDAVHRPSVDALFESAAASWGRRVLAVVLTGMGDDGLAGARAVVAAGGEVLTESESSCVVYGMPRVVRQAGLSVAQAPIERMAAEILARL